VTEIDPLAVSGSCGIAHLKAGEDALAILRPQDDTIETGGHLDVLLAALKERVLQRVVDTDPFSVQSLSLVSLDRSG
jgi:hypothetical protein